MEGWVVAVTIVVDRVDRQQVVCPCLVSSGQRRFDIFNALAHKFISRSIYSMSIKSLEYWIEINTSRNAECGHDSQTHARPMRDPCLAHAGPMRDPCRTHAVPMPCPCRTHAVTLPYLDGQSSVRSGMGKAWVWHGRGMGEHGKAITQCD